MSDGDSDDAERAVRTVARLAGEGDEHGGAAPGEGQAITVHTVQLGRSSYDTLQRMARPAEGYHHVEKASQLGGVFSLVAGEIKGAAGKPYVVTPDMFLRWYAPTLVSLERSARLASHLASPCCRPP